MFASNWIHGSRLLFACKIAQPICMALFCWIWAGLVVLFWRQITTTHTISIFLIFLGSSFVVETCKTAHFNNLFSELSQCNRSNIILHYFRVQTRKLGQLTMSKQARKFGLHDRSEVPYTLMLFYHCHKPVFTPKMASFQRAGIREGGMPLPLAFQYLILLIWRPYDLNLVMIS